MALVFDIETNGLLREGLTKIHCICTYNTETKEALSYFGPSLHNGIKALCEADVLVGHNIIKYDIMAIKAVTGIDVRETGKMFDTFLVSTMIHGDLARRDARSRVIPQALWGKHSLKAWGYRLGEYKGEYAENTDWATFDLDMLRYCEQDVKVTASLYATLLSQIDKELTVSLTAEHRVWRIIAEQEEHGFRFAAEKAQEFFDKLSMEIGETKIALRTLFGTRVKSKGEKVPKITRKYKGAQYTKGCAYTAIEYTEFNPMSGDDVAYWLQRLYNWQPTELTPTGRPQVTADILVDLPYPEAARLAKLQFLVKVASFFWSEKGAGWLQLYKEETQSIHGSVNVNGAATSRMTHSAPNMANIPSVKKSRWNPLREEYGKLCRSLFHAKPGYKIVGCDAAGLELRCLAHYMAAYDGGAYANTVVKGNKEDGTDIHTVNQKFAGLPTRDAAKTFIYALIYGAGDAKIGSIVGGGAKQGKAMKQRFLDGLPALKTLMGNVHKAIKLRGYVRGIDGRRIHCDSMHKSLNYLLQSAGAIAMKHALINIDNYAKAEDIDYSWCVNVHDEYQAEVREDQATRFAELAVKAIVDAGNSLGFKCPLDGEAKIGNNWAETH